MNEIELISSLYEDKIKLLIQHNDNIIYIFRDIVREYESMLYGKFNNMVECQKYIESNISLQNLLHLAYRQYPNYDPNYLFKSKHINS